MSRLGLWFKTRHINDVPVPHLYVVSRDKICRDLLDLSERMENLARKMDKDAASHIRRSNEVDEMRRDVQRLVEMQETGK